MKPIHYSTTSRKQFNIQQLPNPDYFSSTSSSQKFTPYKEGFSSMNSKKYQTTLLSSNSGPSLKTYPKQEQSNYSTLASAKPKLSYDLTFSEPCNQEIIEELQSTSRRNLNSYLKENLSTRNSESEFQGHKHRFIQTLHHLPTDRIQPDKINIHRATFQGFTRNKEVVPIYPKGLLIQDESSSVEVQNNVHNLPHQSTNTMRGGQISFLQKVDKHSNINSPPIFTVQEGSKTEFIIKSERIDFDQMRPL